MNKMGTSKTEIFTAHENQLANYAKALSHPARIAILQYLMKTNICICGDIVNEIGLAQATVSQHLKELKRIGIIQGSVKGTSVCYCINTEVWNELRTLLSNFMQIPAEQAQNCC